MELPSWRGPAVRSATAWDSHIRETYKSGVKSSLYAIRHAYHAIKFGIARDVGKRLCHLQLATWVPLDLMASIVIPTNPYKFETAVHRSFRRFKIRGEWFEVNTNTMEFAEAMAARDFDDLRTLTLRNLDDEWRSYGMDEPAPVDFTDGL